MTQPTWKYEEIKIANISKPVYKIVTSELNKLLTTHLLSYWKGEEKDNQVRFPGAQPVSIEKRNFSQLKKEPYVVCAKLDGQRYMLYTTEVYSNLNDANSEKIKVAFLVNRLFEWFIVCQNFKETAYKDSLFDGELIDDKFIIHDTIAINGENIKNEPWETRWVKCNQFLVHHYFLSENNTFQIQLKEFFHFNQIKSLFQKIRKDNIKSDGIVFYPMKDPVKYRNQENLFKWKPPGKHTIDFKINIIQDKVKLMTWGQGKPIEFDEVSLETFIEQGFEPQSEEVYEFIGVKGNFKPIIHRKDKPVGNSLYTVRKTLQNIRENITEQDLIQLSNFSG